MVAGDYRSALRGATARLHGELDALFGRFDLGDPDGLTRFLVAHAIGMHACQPRAARFGGQQLGSGAPDYSGVLQRDLTILRVDTGQLPRWELPGDGDDARADAGVFYVVAGSRMGTAVLRDRATAATAAGPAYSACGYFAVGEGPAMWRRFRNWLAVQGPVNEAGTTPPDLGAMIDAAKATFQLFARAAQWAATQPDMATGGIAA